MPLEIDKYTILLMIAVACSAVMLIITVVNLFSKPDTKAASTTKDNNDNDNNNVKQRDDMTDAITPKLYTQMNRSSNPFSDYQ